MFPAAVRTPVLPELVTQRAEKLLWICSQHNQVCRFVLWAALAGMKTDLGSRQRGEALGLHLTFIPITGCHILGDSGLQLRGPLPTVPRPVPERASC